MEFTKGRVISLIIAIIFVVIAGITGAQNPGTTLTLKGFREVNGFTDSLGMLCLMLLSLACIWWPEEMGDFTAPNGRGRDIPMPAALVKLAGWTLLFSPLWGPLVVKILSS